MNLAGLQDLAAQQAAARAAARSLAERVRAELGARVAWIRLFGSLARGDWMGADESDVDIAFVLHERVPGDVDRIIRLGTESLLANGFVVSPHIMTVAEFDELARRELRLARDIQAEGWLL